MEVVEEQLLNWQKETFLMESLSQRTAFCGQIGTGRNAQTCAILLYISTLKIDLDNLQKTCTEGRQADGGKTAFSELCPGTHWQAI